MDDKDVELIEQVEVFFQKYRSTNIPTDLKIALLDLSKSATMCKIILLKHQIHIYD